MVHAASGFQFVRMASTRAMVAGVMGRGTQSHRVRIRSVGRISPHAWRSPATRNSQHARRDPATRNSQHARICRSAQMNPSTRTNPQNQGR